MTYTSYTFMSGSWTGRLLPSGWAQFNSHEGHRHHVSMAAIAATQAQAEAYVKAKVESLARGEPANKYIEVE